MKTALILTIAFVVATAGLVVAAIWTSDLRFAQTALVTFLAVLVAAITAINLAGSKR